MDCKIFPSENINTNHLISDIPGDKSISHRAVIISSLSQNRVKFSNFLFSEDCLNTIKIFQSLGVNIKINNPQHKIEIEGVGLYGLTPPVENLNVGNSGTSIRLIAGILAGQKFTSVITGDSSIQKRPMKRIITPLVAMGAKIKGEKQNNNIYPPLKIIGAPLNNIEYLLPIPSAQLKSCIMLASLYSLKKTIIYQKETSRDHTERMLKLFNADLKIKDKTIEISGSKKLSLINSKSTSIAIPSDISSAAFFMVLGLILKNSKLCLKNIGLNPTRNKISHILKEMEGKIITTNFSEEFEPRGDIEIKSSVLKNLKINQDIPYFIDEIPILAVAAMFGKGKFIIRNAQELRVKESDRIKAIVNLVRKMGGHILEFEDGFEITPTGEFQDFELDPNLDHRIAMSAIIGAIAAGKTALIKNCDCINTSFPNFFSILKKLNIKYDIL